MADESRNLTDAVAFEHLVAIVRELREKCVWDHEQKLADTPRHLIEEAYEVGDAIRSEDLSDVAEELGDVITQALFIATIASESGEVPLPQLLKDAAQKLIRRHPQVYSDSKASTYDEVLDQWDKIKAGEKKRRANESSLSKTGRALPSLMRAEKIGQKARRLGFDWQNAREVLAKVREELDEVERALDANDNASAAEEVGDMMLAIANMPRFLGRDAEQTLRQSCDKFVTRFGAVERIASERKLKMTNMSPAELEALWQEAKRSLIKEQS